MKLETGTTTSVLSIFTSASTLICCALPALLVSLGAGATLVAIVGAVPQMVWLSERKLGVFLVAGVMLAMAGYMQWRARHAPCPVDVALRDACLRARRQSRGIYWVSLGMFLVGGFFAFVVPLIMQASY